MEVTLEALRSLQETCRTVKDPRTPINIFHPAENIIAISIAAIIAGAEGPKSIARWARSKKEWLQSWLDLALRAKHLVAIASERSWGKSTLSLFRHVSSTGSINACSTIGSPMDSRWWPSMGRRCGIRSTQPSRCGRYISSARGWPTITFLWGK